MTGRRVTEAFADLARTISHLLYELDPDGIGSSIDAPLDEYDDLSWRLARAVVAREDRDEVRLAVVETFPGATDDLVDGVWSARQTYGERSANDA